MAAAGAKRKDKKSDEKSTGDVVRDLWQLLKDYAAQETIDPLRSLGRLLSRGVPGSISLGFGLMFLSLGLLRALQTETGRHLTGSLDWVPYAVTLVVTILLTVLAVRAIGRPARARAKEGRK